MKDYLIYKNQIEKIISNVKVQVCVSFYDLDLKKSFSINGDKKVLSASLIKILIMATVMKNIKENKLSLEDKISITENMKTNGDGILKELSAEHKFSIKELITLMIILSDNQATNILIDIVGMENINILAQELELKQTVLERKMMDNVARKNGKDNYCCADDIALLLKMIFEKNLIDEKSSDLMLEILSKQQQGERLQRYLPDDIKIAHKCGDLKNVENDAGIIWTRSKKYILVVLVSFVKNNLEAKQIIGEISRYIYKKMEE